VLKGGGPTGGSPHSGHQPAITQLSAAVRGAIASPRAMYDTIKAFMVLAERGEVT